LVSRGECDAVGIGGGKGDAAEAAGAGGGNEADDAAVGLERGGAERGACDAEGGIGETGGERTEVEIGGLAGGGERVRRGEVGEVVFEARVTVAVGIFVVAGGAGVGAEGVFPKIGEAIVVGVGGDVVGRVGGPRVVGRTGGVFHVLGLVDDTGVVALGGLADAIGVVGRARAGVGGGAGADLVDDAAVDDVGLRLVGADIGEDEFVGLGGGVGGDVGLEERGVGADLRGDGRAVLEGGAPVVGEVAFPLHDVAGEVVFRDAPGLVDGVELEEPGHVGIWRVGLVVVVDVVAEEHAAVGGAGSPVVDDVVADIEGAGVFAVLREAAGEGPIAIGAMGEEIVVVAADLAADGAGEGVGLELGAIGGGVMVGMLEGLGDEVALERDVAAVAGARALVDRPADRAVVDDGVIGADAHADAVHRGLRRLAEPLPHEAHDDVVGAADTGGVVGETDALTGRGLAGDGHIGILGGDRAGAL